MSYDVFISYSHARDGVIATSLERALKGLARPWHKRTALRVFRDQTSLGAAADLTKAIYNALGQANWFLCIASQEAAASKWVGKEIAAWLARGLEGRILIALTDGELVWDEPAQRFDAMRSTALHPGLIDAIRVEPLWVDLRWARGEAQLSHRIPRFQEASARLAAPIHGFNVDELIGEDVAQHRRTKNIVRLVVSGTVGLLATALLAVTLTMLATNNLRRKTILQQTAFPLFSVERADVGGGEGEREGGWRQLWSSVTAGLTNAPSEELVEWGPSFLAHKEKCLAEIQRGDLRLYQCPARAQDYDGNGLRADIPRLRELAQAIASAATDGHLSSLLEQSRDRDIGDTPTPRQANSEEIPLDQLAALLPQAMLVGVPGAKELSFDPERDTRWFRMWSKPIDKDVELVFLRLSDLGFCGSRGCSELLLAVLRVKGRHAVVFAREMTSPQLALYDAGQGNMPQIFAIETSQSGVSSQYRKYVQLWFNRETVGYEVYLSGGSESDSNSSVDQSVPYSLE